MTEWNPNDPDIVKVHYDVTAWTMDQRAQLAEALADDDIAHAWTEADGIDELVVPEEAEDVTDALLSRLEAALGPFPIPLGGEDNPIEYGLDEWPAGDRSTLATALIEQEVPHRWDDATLYVPVAAEEVVDELLDQLEAGTLAVHGADDEAPPVDALSRLFTAADRLAKNPEDRVGRGDITALASVLVPGRAPYGVGGAAWSKIVTTTGGLGELIDDLDAEGSDIIELAQALRTSVRDYV